MQHRRLIILISFLLNYWENRAFAPSNKRVVKRWVDVGPNYHPQLPVKHMYPIEIRMPSHLSSSMAPVSVASIIESIFTSSQTVPLYLSLAVNTSLFVALRDKLNKVLTPEGYMHALALGTMLWHCLGWKV